MGSLCLEDSAACDQDAAQVFLFSSQPRVVDTIGPVSPAGPTLAKQVRAFEYLRIRLFNAVCIFRMPVMMNPKHMKLLNNFLKQTNNLCTFQMLQSV